MFLSGYDIPATDARRLAEAPDGPIAQQIMTLSEHAGVAIVYRYPELGPSGEVYNAAQIVDGSVLLGSHRKTHLFGELDRRSFAPAPSASVVATMRGRTVCARSAC
jgi:predicted amidohydrolase